MAATEALVLARISKDAEEDVVVRRNSHQGNDFIDARVFTADRTGKLGLPQAAGLCLPPDTWRQLIPLLEAALAGEAGAGDGGAAALQHEAQVEAA